MCVKRPPPSEPPFSKPPTVVVPATNPLPHEWRVTTNPKGLPLPPDLVREVEEMGRLAALRKHLEAAMKIVDTLEVATPTRRSVAPSGLTPADIEIGARYKIGYRPSGGKPEWVVAIVVGKKPKSQKYELRREGAELGAGGRKIFRRPNQIYRIDQPEEGVPPVA